MSRDILQDMVAVIGRMRGDPMDMERVDELAARLEAHLVELEFLATHTVPISLEPAFVATPVSPERAAGAPAGPIGAPGGPTAVSEWASDTMMQVRDSTWIGAQGGGGTTALAAGVTRGSPRTLTAALGMLRAGQISPVELIEQHLERIRQTDALKAFIAVFEEQARREALAAQQALVSGSAGLLSGIPLAVKDLLCMRGYAMTGGSRALDETPSSSDADVVARLRAVGAVIVGAANLHELAYGVTSENPHFGAVRNPRRTDHMAGGSSGGSAAAVAAHLVLGAIGTDTGGSIRIPAAACGVVGLKPTYGRVSRQGVLPLSWSLDHVGPLAGTCADAAILFAAMADAPLREELAFARTLIEQNPPPEDERALHPPLEAAARLAGAMVGQPGEQVDPTSTISRARETLIGLRVGRPPDEWLGPLQDDVADAWKTVLDRLKEAGACVSVLDPPPMSSVRAAQFIILHTEAAAIHREHLRLRAADLGPDVRLRLKLGELLLAVDYVQGQRLRRQVADGFLRLFDRVDVFVLPALPVTAPALGTRLVTAGDTVEPVHRALTRYTAAFNLSGLPALVVPIGTDARGLPLSVQIVGRPFRELDMMRVGIALEALGRLL